MQVLHVNIFRSFVIPIFRSMNPGVIMNCIMAHARAAFRRIPGGGFGICVSCMEATLPYYEANDRTVLSLAS